MLLVRLPKQTVRGSLTPPVQTEPICEVFGDRSKHKTPVKETTRSSRKRYEIQFGSSCIVKNDVKKAFEIFVDNVLSGSEGLCITRQFPPKVRKKYGLQRTPIVRLTQEKVEREQTVYSLQDLSTMVKSFLASVNEGIVLLDGIEYLVLNHEFGSVVRLIQSLRSRVEMKKSILIAPLFDDTLDVKYVKLIEREMQPLP